MPVLMMVKTIMQGISSSFFTRGQAARKLLNDGGTFTQSAKERIHDLIKLSHKYKVRLTNFTEQLLEGVVESTTRSLGVSANLQTHVVHCPCERMKDHGGNLCMHATALLLEASKRKEKWAQNWRHWDPEWYDAATSLLSAHAAQYSKPPHRSTVLSIEHINLVPWEIPDSLSGRRRINRFQRAPKHTIKVDDDGPEDMLPRKRKKTPPTCSLCGLTGHNKNRCPKPSRERLVEMSYFLPGPEYLRGTISSPGGLWGLCFMLSPVSGHVWGYVS